MKHKMKHTWTHIKMPAIAVENETWECGDQTYYRKAGEALNPEREPLDVLAYVKQEMGSYKFAAQYQQEPFPIEGTIINKKWFNYYTTFPNFSRILISWDIACKTGKNNDYTVCTIWGVVGGSYREYYLLHVYRRKIEFPKLRNLVKSFYNQCIEKYKCSVFVLVEDTVSGTPLIQDLKQEQMIIKAVQPKGDKESRFIETSSIFEQGRIFLPKKDYPWKTEYINELLRFPQTKHDDQVDSTTQVLLWDYRISEGFFNQTMHGSINVYTVPFNRKNPARYNPDRQNFVRTNPKRVYSMRDNGKYDHLDPKTAFIMRLLDQP